MKKIILTSLLSLMGIMLFAQNEINFKEELDSDSTSLKTQIEGIKKINESLQLEIQKYHEENQDLKTNVVNLKNSLDAINKKVAELENTISNTEGKITGFDNKLSATDKTFNDKLSEANKNVESLRQQTDSNKTYMQKTAVELGGKIDESNENLSQISSIANSLSRSTLFAIIGVLLAFIISGIIYWMLSKRQKMDKFEVLDQMNETKKSIEENIVNEFGKQADLIETQLELLSQQKQEVPASSDAEIDHSLALKVASEINLIERNISMMDKGTKGLKQLVRSVVKLKENLAANGYDMPELLGKKYNEGMKMLVANFVDDENLEKDEKIISKVLKPQVNYKDKMIQTAEVDVLLGV